MSESTIRHLFLAVFIGLIIQHGLVGIVGYYASEPWPAIVLPSFMGIYDRDGVVESHDHRIEVELEDGLRTSLDRSTFMTFMPIIHQSAFLKNQCRPASLSGTERTEMCKQPEGNSSS